MEYVIFASTLVIGLELIDFGKAKFNIINFNVLILTNEECWLVTHGRE
jgi:hypothetical protein